MPEKVPLAVLAACARRGLAVGDLDGWQVTDVDVYLALKTGELVRVELSGLPELETPTLSEPVPVTTTPVTPSPVAVRRLAKAAKRKR